VIAKPVIAEPVIAEPVMPAPAAVIAPVMPAPAMVAAPATPAALADDGALIDSLSSVLEQLRELYAETLGYPAEAMTPEADLEADLGIDSLKRAEMLAKVTSHFRLEDLEEGQLASHQTLAELASLVAAAVRPAS
jgi:[acyl-carrier-protein] S-malonyltransferase